MKRLMCFDSVLSTVLLLFIITDGLSINIWENASEADNFYGRQNLKLASMTYTFCNYVPRNLWTLIESESCEWNMWGILDNFKIKLCCRWNFADVNEVSNHLTLS